MEPTQKRREIEVEATGVGKEDRGSKIEDSLGAEGEGIEDRGSKMGDRRRAEGARVRLRGKNENIATPFVATVWPGGSRSEA